MCTAYLFDPNGKYNDDYNDDITIPLNQNMQECSNLSGVISLTGILTLIAIALILLYLLLSLFKYGIKFYDTVETKNMYDLVPGLYSVTEKSFLECFLVFFLYINIYFLYADETVGDGKGIYIYIDR